MAPDHPSVTVVIPTFNAADLIEDCLRSVYAQTQSVDQIVVVDDASTDALSDVLESYSRRIEVVRHESNLGLSEARNSGARRSHGDLIVFLDADDSWMPDMVEQQLLWFRENPQSGLIYTDIVDCDAELRPMHGGRGFRPRRSEWVFDELYMEAFPIPPSTAFIRREVLEKVGGFEPRLRKSQDYECWLRIAMRFPISCIDRPLCRRRLHPGSITSATTAVERIEYERLAFALCAEAADRAGVPLPLPLRDRLTLCWRRRMLELASARDVDGALRYRDLLLSDGSLRFRDRLSLSYHQVAARLTSRRSAAAT